MAFYGLQKQGFQRQTGPRSSVKSLTAQVSYLILMGALCVTTSQSFAAAPTPPTLPTPPAANALPTGFKTTWGNTKSAITVNTLTITQSTPYAFVRWSNFSIGSNATVTFKNTTAGNLGTYSTLNIIEGTAPSKIYGSLTSQNDNVYLVNQAGIVIGPKGNVNLQGNFVATTIGIDLYNYAGRNDPGVTGKAPPAGSVNIPLPNYGVVSSSIINFGNINVSNPPLLLGGAYVDLEGGSISNMGTINVPNNFGTVMLAGWYRDNKNNKALTPQVSVENYGTLKANGLSGTVAIIDVNKSFDKSGNVLAARNDYVYNDGKIYAQNDFMIISKYFLNNHDIHAGIVLFNPYVTTKGTFDIHGTSMSLAEAEFENTYNPTALDLISGQYDYTLEIPYYVFESGAKGDPVRAPQDKANDKVNNSGLIISLVMGNKNVAAQANGTTVTDLPTGLTNHIGTTNGTIDALSYLGRGSNCLSTVCATSLKGKLVGNVIHTKTASSNVVGFSAVPETPEESTVTNLAATLAEPMVLPIATKLTTLFGQ